MGTDARTLSYSAWARSVPIGGFRATAIVAAMALGTGVGVASTWAPAYTAAAAIAVAVVVAVVARPATAAYLLVGVTPLIAGIDRGRLIPLLRPHEALLLIVGGATLLWKLAERLHGRPSRNRFFGRVEFSILALACTASFLPLLWMVARGKGITEDDLLSALLPWKYCAAFAVVRMTVRSQAEVRRCLVMAMTAGAIVSVVAILQVLGSHAVTALLSRYYAPFGLREVVVNSRGSSTLALPAAVADLMIFNLAITVAAMRRTAVRRGWLIGAASLYTFGVVAAGQFSGVIGLVAAAVAIAFVTGSLHISLWLGLPLVPAMLFLRPVIQQRLDGFNSPTGLPDSWTGRLRNLRTYFWSELSHHFNYVLGVRPSARLPAPETASGWVWIESGHTWLLWVGGLPLLAAFGLLLWDGLRITAEVAWNRNDAVGLAAMAAFVSLAVMAAGMAFDPHLTYRGSADLLFCLLALATLRLPVEPDSASATTAKVSPCRPLD